MKKLYFLLFTILISSGSFGQTTVFSESFETDGNGSRYTTSQVEFSDNFGDFFGRTNLNATAEDSADLPVGTFYSLSGTDGNFCFATMDFDAANATGSGGASTQFIEFNNIDITGFTNLSFAILLAEDKDGTSNDWDDDSRFYVEIDIDNSGSFTKILQVSTADATGGTNVSQPMIDSDFDGNGDGAEITDTFTEYAVAISSGSEVDVRLVFENLLAGDEDMAVDLIRIVDGFSVSPSTIVGGNVAEMSYEVGNGPSSEQFFTVEGADLTDDITITPPSSFEISTTSGSGFSSMPITLTPTSGTVNNTTIYTRLIGGLAVGDYNEIITVSTAGTSDKTVNVNGSVFNPLTNALVITGVFDAADGSSPKGIEIQALADISDLSVFGIGSANNGGGTDGEEFTFPADALSNGEKIYVIASGQTAKFNTFFGVSLSPYESGAASINGDDAIELFENGQVIDTFGDINTDGTGQAWDYVDGWAYRNDNTGPDGSTFIIANWTFSGTAQLEAATNAASMVPFPFATFSLSNDNFNIRKFSIFPNPTNTGEVTISSANSSSIAVSVYDILGKRVKNETISNNRLDVSNLKSGIYLLRLTQDGATSTKKLVVR